MRTTTITRSTNTMFRTLAPAAVLGLALAGCSSNAASPSSGSMGGMDMGSGSMSASTSASAPASAQPGVVFNAADVTFAKDMYPHHAQAVETAKMVQGRTQNKAVIDLAKAIEGAQAPEMQQMTTLLTSFGEPAPSADMGGMAGMSGMSSMSGMMSTQEMDAMKNASGASFDKMWLTNMVKHHTRAIQVAQTELKNGQNPDAKKLATDIVAAQQAEIQTMNGLLAQA